MSPFEGRRTRAALVQLLAGMGLIALLLALAQPSAEAGSRQATAPSCGATVYKASGIAWKCRFADDFGGSTLDRTKWVPQTNFSAGTSSAFACYLDDPSVISLANGSLNLTVRSVAVPVACSSGGPTQYVAGMVSTYRLFSQQYGRFEARIRSTAAQSPGLQESFWLWPDDRVASTSTWPNSGEIDISETYSQYPTLSIPFLHYSADAQGAQPGLNTAWDCTANRGQWNTYTVVWSASRIEIFVNGRSCLVNTSGDTAFQKPYIVALTQALGVGSNGFDGSAPLPATMSIDYVRVWS